MPDGRLACAPAPLHAPVPVGFRIHLDHWTRVWAGGAVLVGGAPWRISTVSAAVGGMARRLAEAGEAGIEVGDAREAQIARVLLDRGFAHPVVEARPAAPLTLVVPVLDRPEQLAELLDSMPGRDCLVVDDGSVDAAAIARVAATRGATVIRHARNEGPAAARNTALRVVPGPLIAFTDSDCIAGEGWPDALQGHFDDPRVAVVAPRIEPLVQGAGALAAYERSRSALDMGRRSHLVIPGGRLGFVPSAALIVRTAAVQPDGFDERLRLGEDVDLVWRLAEAGWQVRYDPRVRVLHRARPNLRERLWRIHQYGTSAADLESRHPGRLTPARLSAWNVAALGLAGVGHPVAGGAVATVAAVLLWRRLRALPQAPLLAGRTVGMGVVADSVQVGRLLRCEWAPVGAAVLLAAPRSRTARVAAAAMVGPLVWEWVHERPALDPLRYVGLRLLDDAAYGSGVIRASVRARTIRPLTPQITVPEALKSRWPSRWRSRRSSSRP